MEGKREMRSSFVQTHIHTQKEKTGEEGGEEEIIPAC